MPTREEMQSLAEEIVRSYEDRISGIVELRKIVKADLKEFQDSRAVMARDLRADLAQSVAARKAAVSSQLKELDAAHASMSRELKADLAKVRPALEEEDRKRQSEAREFRGELGRAVAQGKTAVKAQLEEFDRTHASMSRELKADLAKVRPALEEEDRKRQSEAREFRGELGRAVAQGKTAIQALLKDFGEVQAGVRDEWQKMTATMQSKRGGVAGAAKPPIEEIAKGAASITPEIAALREKVFEYLANHPDGTKLVELAEEFGVARIQVAKVVRSLIDENKIEKRDLLYFAV